MIADWPLAEALAVKRLHGGQAHVLVAECIGELALAGDVAGVERFRAIAAKLDALMRSSRH